ncbi:MAG: hypothetical protein WA908_12295 [Pontixanthobacter sp.]
MRIPGWFAAGVAVCALTACAGGGSRPSFSDRQIDRLLVNAPGEAQPSRIVATEVAFGQMIATEGMNAAHRNFAASGAIVHAGGAPVPLKEAIETGAIMNGLRSWRPRAVWTSCDGALAVSQVRYRDGADLAGTAFTFWQRQGDGDYRWHYRLHAVDMPQPPRDETDDTEEFEIVVRALDTIKGIVADCPDADNPVPPGPRTEIVPGMRQGKLNSGDGTLRLVWSHAQNGRRDLSADYFTYRGWAEAIEESFPVASADSQE